MGETEDNSFRWRYVMALQLIYFARRAKDASETPEWKKGHNTEPKERLCIHQL